MSTCNAPPPAVAPVTGRITDIDALRGFALLGILLVNSAAMASAWYGSGLHDPAWAGKVDGLVRDVISALFETKFYLLFSFLFGYSFTLQLASADREGAAFVPRFLRRLLGLALFGIGHALLLFQGDILLTYALLGLLLLGLRQLAPRTAMTLAVTLLALTVISWSLLAVLASFAPTDLPVAALHAHAEQVTAAYRRDITSVIVQHVRDIQDGVAFVLGFIQAPCALAMFLLGLAAGKTGALQTLAADPARCMKLLRWSLLPGLLGALLYITPALHGTREHLALWALAIDLLSAPLLAFAWLLLLLRALHSRIGSTLGAWLAPAGRMALSNYLLQSLIGALIYTAWGWALIGRVSPLQTLLIALAIYGAQLWLSRRWMRTHAYGPAEWLLRALTRWQWPRWKRETAGTKPLTAPGENASS